MKSKSLFKKINQQNLFICLLVIAFICFSNIIFGGFSKDTFLKMLNSLSSCLGFCFIVLLSRNYGNFKLSIQNGMSRKQFFKSKMFIIIFSAFLSSLFSYIITIIIYILDKSYLSSFYISNYFQFFNSYILDLIFMFIADFCMMLFLIVFFNTFGSLMSLFNRMVKFFIYLLLIGLTVSFFIGIAHEGFYEYFVRIMDNFHVVSVFKFISGFNTIDIDQRHSLANANPINAILTLLISSSILSFISYKITKLQQVNR
ncbi:hypothetical protein DY138_05350 [Apilactobacillus timberlakei]|uniref:hypothetical protein n=2 Tax=Apilactobacillus timberlakei TaxID=2008380 RepID=UPI00112D0C73|nr:hypothetical protein [Apilactobacillus timberlakei]TPR18507.1 hypothetical protein DY138_05350 [Apilactobacillus timberlakei]TPR20354.1 hypothetical protein DY061_05260 [Apilactobacillus timberlakei]TPR22117.1 hypothetical protein DY083_05250 [Apilactobacillus timberlakei]